MAIGVRGDDPLATADLVRFLRAGISERIILAELRDRGFGEPLDSARETQLRDAGATRDPDRRRAARRARVRTRGGGAGAAGRRSSTEPPPPAATPDFPTATTPRSRSDLQRQHPHRARARLRPRQAREPRHGAPGRGLPDRGGREEAGGHLLQRRAAAPAHRARPRREREHGEQDPRGGGRAAPLHRPARAGGRDPRPHVQRQRATSCRTSRPTATAWAAC